MVNLNFKQSSLVSITVDKVAWYFSYAPGWLQGAQPSLETTYSWLFEETKERTGLEKERIKEGGKENVSTHFPYPARKVIARKSLYS